MTTAFALALHLIVGTSLAPDTLKHPPREGWFALCRDADGAGRDALVPVTVQFLRKPWPVDENLTWAPRAKGCTKTVALLRDLPWLAARPVVRATVERHEDKAARSVQFAITLVGAKYVVIDRDIGRNDAEDHRVTLRTPDGSKQALKPFDSPRDTVVEVVWAGDVDGDGKLDLLLRVPAHYAGPVHRLYVSSAAKGKSLLEWVAEQLDATC